MNDFQVPKWLPSSLVPFITLSHPTGPPANPDSFHDSFYYTTGILDACLIVTCIAVMAVLRDIARIYLMEPFAKWKLTHDWEGSQRNKIGINGAHKGFVSGSSVLDGVTSHKNREYAPLTMSRKDAHRIQRNTLRFAEQGWSLIYYAVNFNFGIYVYHNLPTRMLDLTDVWLKYPHVPLAGPVKFYYLIQIAFYLHQLLILNAEARRRDHLQMMAHHIITTILAVTSYTCNLTRYGCVVIVLTDWCDLVLPLAKMLRYIGLYTLCDMTFVVFLISWFITRHVLFIIVIKSFCIDSVRLVSEMWAPERGNYLLPLIHKTISLLLISLQVIQIIWFGMICRVAWRVVTGQGASDDRSDEEDEKVHCD